MLGFDHVNSKKRLYKNYDRFMYFVAFLSPAAVAPQVIAIYQTHDVSGLVLVTWATFATINCLWLIYGFMHKEPPIILQGGMMLLFNVAGAIGIILFAH